MLHSHLISAGANFWVNSADWILQTTHRELWQAQPALLAQRDYSAIQVIVPTYEHANYLYQAFSERLGQSYIPPQINTLFGLLDMQGPEIGQPAIASPQQRLCQLYQSLREHSFLQSLFGLESQLELLALARTLLILFDELSSALLPRMLEDNQAVADLWQRALNELPASAQACMSEEARMVWTLWLAQLDQHDPAWRRLSSLRQLAGSDKPLFWISPTAPNPFETYLLQHWQAHSPVWICKLAWQAQFMPGVFQQGWPNLHEETALATDSYAKPESLTTYAECSLLVAHSLESEAGQAAQLIVNWLQEGKQGIAVIAQDRLVARRLRALLERSQIKVADETGWKLSTSSAAACLQAWLNLLLPNADSKPLLDLLKSPFVPVISQTQQDAAAVSQESLSFISKDEVVFCIELQARLHLPQQDWRELRGDLPKRNEDAQLAASWLTQLEQQAQPMQGQHSLATWAGLTLRCLRALGIWQKFQQDQAGIEITQLLQNYLDVAEFAQGSFSLAEWRALLLAELEEASYIVATTEQRVQMLPLNGARLRRYDAVLLLGADASHLPSQSPELLFFANGVRRELGLVTREHRQQQQLRDLAEVMLNNPLVVFSWQRQINGEPNPVSPWLQQLNLHLELSGQPVLPLCALRLPLQSVEQQVQQAPQISAAELKPEKISASAFHSLLACPYQFFIRYMLKLDPLDDWADDPEKREYGQWLHAILRQFHDEVQMQGVIQTDAQAELLAKISTTYFARVLQKTPVALGFKLRWDKVQADYLSWWQQHQAQGWQFADAEQSVRKSFEIKPDYQILLHGRLDRRDKNQAGQTLVLDYKTRKARLLKQKLDQREDQQLAFYALSDDQVAQALYLSLEQDKDGLQTVQLEDLPAQVDALSQALRQQLAQISEGADLPAQGSAEACNYCSARGLCRKGMWY